MLGIRAPAARRARPQGARAAGGLRAYRGRWGLAVRAEMRGRGKGEEHSGHPGQAGGREIVPSGGARGSAATSETFRGKVGRPSTEHKRRSADKARNPRALGSSGFSARAFGLHPGQTFGCHRTRDLTLFATPTPPPIRTLPVARYAMRHLSVTLSDSATPAPQRPVNLNPL